MSADLSYRRLPSCGHGEWLTQVGGGPPLLLLPPLFEEMNRCRAILVGTARVLASRGYTVHMPDLPGTGESKRRLENVAWKDWRDFAGQLAAELKPLAILSVRGGSLLEPAGAPCWRLSSVDGVRITRELVRTRRAAGEGASAESIDGAARRVSTEFAGYTLGPALYAGLADATLPDAPSRTVRLRGEAAAADRVIDAAPPWRTAEPRRDPALSQALGDDIADWLAACAA